MNTVREIVTAAVDNHDWGTASARKAGRTPARPYVPIIKYKIAAPGKFTRTSQFLGYAYATREEAIAKAQRVIEATRETKINRLMEVVGARSERAYYGLPRELSDLLALEEAVAR